MASKTHTPGPWIVTGYRIEGPVDPRSKHRSGRTLIGGVVDDMNDWRGCPSETREERSAFAKETTANAHLIAAAPELLEAIKRALDFFEVNMGPLFGPDHNIPMAGASLTIDSLNLALAKAEGR